MKDDGLFGEDDGSIDYGPDPWKGKDEEFEPKKKVAPGTYSWHIWKWDWAYKGRADRIVMIGQVDKDDPGNGLEGGNELWQFFWANAKYELKAFLCAVLGEDTYDMFGGNKELRSVVNQSLGYPFLCGVVHNKGKKDDKIYANFDLSTTKAYPDGEIVIPVYEETDFPFGNNA